MEKKYVCPMHPEVISNQPGKCPKCGMDLVESSRLEGQKEANRIGLGKLSWTNYLPLIVVIGLILLTSIAVSLNNLELKRFVTNFMIGFFLVFGGFKLLDLKGFVEGYRMYDLLAIRFPAYGFIYPFIELFFAFAMILNLLPTVILIAEVLVMGFSGVGVLLKILKKEKFQCVCLGTTLKVPLTTVTLVEDFGMAALAVFLLIS